MAVEMCRPDGSGNMKKQVKLIDILEVKLRAGLWVSLCSLDCGLEMIKCVLYRDLLPGLH